MTIGHALQEMLCELHSHQLLVALTPSRRSDRREWDMIRTKFDENPRWYRDHCANHVSSRGVRRGKFDTRIRRRRTIEALMGLIQGTYKGKYADDLLQFARERCKPKKKHKVA